MTEADARKKWCPFARTHLPWVDNDGEVRAMASVNRYDNGGPDDACLCIASDCMAWRWFAYYGPEGILQSSDDGYCGLAHPRAP